MVKRGKHRTVRHQIAMVAAALIVVWAAACQMPPENPFLPELVLPGFEQASPIVVYNENNIFDYINGEAEVYFPFGFRLLYTMSYRSEKSDAVMTVDAYDMGSADGARGVFERYAKESGSEISGLGEAGWTDNYSVLFRRGKYFVRVFPDPSAATEIEAGPEELNALSRAIDKTL